MPLTSNLAEIMRTREITYEELQYRAGVAPDTLARARDKRIASCQLKTLEKLANALYVGVSDLFTHIPPKSKS